MRIKVNNKNNGWKRRFAFLPFKINDEIIWMERYWSRFEGIYYNVRKYEDKPF
jgi:hypothetical protein